jgi:HD-like signal output (HDOD) protein
MQQQDIKTLAQWVAFLSRAEIPVLKQTARDLATLRLDPEKLSPRGMAQIIAQDPMMTVKLLRYLQSHKRDSQQHDVMEVEQALLMIGVEGFFSKLPAKPLIDEILRAQMEALVYLLHVVRRSHRASSYAYDWAVRLRDLHFEEVRIAALLYDLAEMLMWCFAPDEMLKIRTLQQKEKSLRSRTVQEEVLGFALADLQQALAREWALPDLLLALMDGKNDQKSRVRNVVLAVNLARHSANSWDDAALPDDYRDIGKLLGMPVESVMVMIGAEAGQVCDLNKPHL